MNSFELITEFLPRAIDRYFVEDSATAILEKGSKYIDVKFDQTGYVKIADILLDGLSDYYQTQQNSVDYLNPGSARPSNPNDYAAYAGNMPTGGRDGFRIGGVDIRWEILRLQWVRGKQFRIDYISDEETAGIIIGNALEEFNRVKVIPEVDVARFGVIAEHTATSLGNRVELTADPSGAQSSGAYINAKDGPTGVITRFNEAFEFLKEMGVPVDQQIIYVNPTVMTMIRTSKELVHFITQGDYRNEAGITFTVDKYEKRPIIEVQSDRFFTSPVLDDGGYHASSASKLINFMVVSTKAVVPVRKLEWSKIYGPEQSGLAGFHGYLIDYLLYHGCFVPRNKAVGVYLCVDPTENSAAAKVNLLRVHIVNPSAKTWQMINYFTNPAGMRGTVVYSATSLGAIGDSVTIDESTVKSVALNEVVSEADAVADVEYYFGLVNAAGKLVAKTTGTIKVVDL